MWTRPLVLWLLLAVFVVAPAFAEPPAAGDAGAPAASSEPDLISANLDLPSMVAAIVTFLVLLVVLTKLAWKPILTGLQRREDVIKKAVDDAERANAEARALAAEYRSRLDEATEKARQIAEEGKRAAEVVAQRIEAEARRQAEETTARAVRDVRQAADDAYDRILSDVTALATEAASKIVRRQLTPEDNADLVDEVVGAFERDRHRSAT